MEISLKTITLLLWSAKMQKWSIVAELEISFIDIGFSHCPILQDYYRFIVS